MGKPRMTFNPSEVAERVASDEWPDYSYLSTAIHRGHARRIPKDAWRQVDFSAPSPARRSTLLHTAALVGRLDELPRESLSEDALTVADARGNTPLHMAARFGYIYQVPSELLTERTLSAPNKAGVTVVGAIEASGFMDQVPEHLRHLPWSVPVERKQRNSPVRPLPVPEGFAQGELEF